MQMKLKCFGYFLKLITFWKLLQTYTFLKIDITILLVDSVMLGSLSSD